MPRIYLLLGILTLIRGQSEGTKVVVAIQPLGAVDSVVIQQVQKGIQAIYQANVIVLSQGKMPASAYYKPNDRYRAEKILAYLDSTGDFNRCTILLGITKKDISTTKGEYHDWGIFGLGYMPGRVCVVSFYRLGRKKVSEKKFFARLTKVVNHELGHNFGLEHCPVDRCLMEDAKGTIKTVDNESGEFCQNCRTRIEDILTEGE